MRSAVNTSGSNFVSACDDVRPDLLVEYAPPAQHAHYDFCDQPVIRRKRAA